MFSKPFIAALEGHADAVEVLSRRPNTITDVASASWDGSGFFFEHVAKITGVYQGKISGLCWADDHRLLSCGADRNMEMWGVGAETT